MKSPFKSMGELVQTQLGPQLAPLRARFETLQPREQLLVGVGSLVAALALIYLILWQPFALARVHRAAELDAARDLAVRIEQIGALGQQSRSAHGPPVVGPEVSLLAAVDQASKDGILGKPLSRINPDGEKQVRVWIDDVNFDALLRWIDDLQSRYGVRIDAVAVERRPTAGLVSARLTLMRAP
jgi:general secretion pathway protein M